MTAPAPVDVVWNLSARIARPRDTDPAILAFHESLPGYNRTPLVQLPELADQVGVKSIDVKLETERYGLPAFKILGASWAIACEIRRRFDVREMTLDGLRAAIGGDDRLTFVAATDGNHGRAVAHMAHLLGQRSRILIPRGMAPARAQAIRDEGAFVDEIDGTYDEAVELSAQIADDTHLTISDTAWDGYEDVPADVIDGYSTIFEEVDRQIAYTPDHIAIQMGVGSLAAAAIRASYRWGCKVVGVEPTGVDCILRSLKEERFLSMPETHDSIMAGLNCGTPSPVAWPELRSGIDLSVAVDDEAAREAMRVYADAGVAAGETGAAGLAGLLSLAEDENWEETRKRLHLGHRSHVLLVVTEGPTDPEAWMRITGRYAEGWA